MTFTRKRDFNLTKRAQTHVHAICKFCCCCCTLCLRVNLNISIAKKNKYRIVFIKAAREGDTASERERGRGDEAPNQNSFINLSIGRAATKNYTKFTFRSIFRFYDLQTTKRRIKTSDERKNMLNERALKEE